MKKSSLLFGAIVLLSLPVTAPAQNSPNLKLVAHLDPLPNVTGNVQSFGEVTGAGDLAILGGLGEDAVWIYDLSDKANPQLLATIPLDGGTLDVQVHGRYLFIAQVFTMAWYDILDPRLPKLVKRFEPPPRFIPHTFFVAGNTLYVADMASGGIRIFDITDKKNPQPLAEIRDPSWGIHDMTVIRGRLYGAWISGQAGLLYADVSNPARPREIAKVRYPRAGTHNAWPTEDGQFILTTDEAGARRNLKIWDARTPGQLVPVAEFAPPGVDPQSRSSVIHNVYVRGRYAYMSYYCEGVRIADIADPSNPKQVAYYDLNGQAECEMLNSNWGVYPFSKLIYASEEREGLYVLEFDDHPAANLAGNVVDAATGAPVAGAMVYFRDEYPTTRTNAAGEFEMPWFKDDTVAVVTEALGYLSDTTTVITHASSPTQLTIRLQGAPRLTIAGTVIDDDQAGGSFGNGNGLIDGVETYELNFLLENSGHADATNGTLRLQSDDPYVSLVDSVQTTGFIAAGQRQLLNGAFRFKVSPATPAGHELSFRLFATLNQQLSEELPFRLSVQVQPIADFRAASTTNSVSLFWRSAKDAQSQGYHIYRKLALEADGEFVKLTASPLLDTTFTVAGLAAGQAHNFAITKVVDGVESLFGARYRIVVRSGAPKVLIVNGINLETYRSEAAPMYAAKPFNAGEIFDAWDVTGTSQSFPEGYAVIGSGRQLAFEDMRNYKVVVWVGNSLASDSEAWKASLPAIKKYLDNGGRLALLIEMPFTHLQEDAFIQDYLHLGQAQILMTGARLQWIAPLRQDLIRMNTYPTIFAPGVGIKNAPANELVEPIFYLNDDRSTTMGIRARRQSNGPYHIVLITGSPLNYDVAAVKTNITTIINQWFGLSTSVDQLAAEPESFALQPNYPNPFMPAIGAAATQIFFSLAQREKVQLEIFNVLGQRVRVLLNAPRESGTHVMQWDGKNEAGQNVAAGVYIMRLRAGKFVAERKMTMIR